MTVFELLSLGGLRRATCADCGAVVALSPLSSFALMLLGTWIPVAGALIGAVLAIEVFHISALLGGAAGLVLSWTLFAAIYFRRARLIVG